jgi:hypothetical protein
MILNRNIIDIIENERNMMYLSGTVTRYEIKKFNSIRMTPISL